MTEPVTVDTVWRDLEAVREQGPLVHNITNYVVMNTTANALLAVGASPVMAHAVEEVADMVGIAAALVLNLGTLSPPWVTAMEVAARAARDRGIPIALDPVGAGATPYRTATAHRLLAEVPPTLVRGNASEVIALATAASGARGVDSVDPSSAALEAAAGLRQRHASVVAVTGATDYVVADGEPIRIDNGHPLMARVTGLGCTATALCGAFLAVNPSPAHATASALVVTGVAGELAAERAEGPGTLQLHLLDALHTLTREQLERRMTAAVGR